MTEYGAPPPMVAPATRPLTVVPGATGTPAPAAGPPGPGVPGPRPPDGPVRAVARVGAEAPRTSEPAILVPRRRPGHIGPVHVLQLLFVEAILLMVLVLAHRHVAVAAGATVLGLVLLVATLTRSQGRWWMERQLMARRFRRRRQARPVPGQHDPRLAAMQWLAPGLTVAELGAPDGSHIGVARDDAGWYAVAAVPPTAAMRDDPRPGLPLDTLVAALVEAEAPGVALQVVTHTVPVSAPTGVAGRSYHDLIRQFGPVPIPVARTTWLVVRLDARALAEAGADQGEGTDQTDGPATIVAALLRRLVKSLRRSGVTATVLDREGLLDALARSCDLQPLPSGAPAAPREDWQVWYSARLAHRCFWLQHWPGLDRAGMLLDTLATVPAAASSVAVVAIPTDDGVDLRCLARVAAPPEDLPRACSGLVRAAQLCRGRLFPLDGEQAPGVYASAPTGGGPR